MKPYTIYQFHDKGAPHKKNLLVGFAMAENAAAAKTDYLNIHYPGDPKTKEQIRGQLAAWECKTENFERRDLLEIIKGNKQTLETSA